MKFDEIPELGTEADRARRSETLRRDTQERKDAITEARSLIYNDGIVVNGARVEAILKEESLVPTEVSLYKLTFFHDAERLSDRMRSPLLWPISLRCSWWIFSMSLSLVSGKLSSCILSASFMHTIPLPLMSWTIGENTRRVLCLSSFSTDMIFSYRQMPTFGRFTIHRFTNNVSELKNLAGRDMEDILQVSSPISTPPK